MAFNRGGSTENPAAETAATTPLGHKADSTGGQWSRLRQGFGAASRRSHGVAFRIRRTSAIACGLRGAL